jgi:hypothetical protein
MSPRASAFAHDAIIVPVFEADSSEQNILSDSQGSAIYVAVLLSVTHMRVLNSSDQAPRATWCLSGSNLLSCGENRTSLPIISE